MRHNEKSCIEKDRQAGTTAKSGIMTIVSTRLLAIALVSVTLISVTVVVLTNRPVPPVVPIETVPDTDHDGVADDADILVTGNGGLLVEILNFRAHEGCRNVLPLLSPACDPQFTVRLDYERDGKWDASQTEAYQDANSIDKPFSHSFDVPDNANRVYLELTILDLDGNDVVDYWSAFAKDFGPFEISPRTPTQTFSLQGTTSVSAELVLVIRLVTLP